MLELLSEDFEHYAVATISGKYFISNIVDQTIYFVLKDDVKNIKLFNTLDGAKHILNSTGWQYVANNQTFPRANLEIVKIHQVFKTFISKIEVKDNSVLE